MSGKGINDGVIGLLCVHSHRHVLVNVLQPAQSFDLAFDHVFLKEVFDNIVMNVVSVGLEGGRLVKIVILKRLVHFIFEIKIKIIDLQNNIEFLTSEKENKNPPSS